MVEHLFTLPNGMECKIVETKIAEHEIELRICKIDGSEIPAIIKERYNNEIIKAILSTCKLENIMTKLYQTTDNERYPQSDGR